MLFAGQNTERERERERTETQRVEEKLLVFTVTMGDFLQKT
jgi:hypothetical protein